MTFRKPLARTQAVSIGAIRILSHILGFDFGGTKTTLLLARRRGEEKPEIVRAEAFPTFPPSVEPLKAFSLLLEKGAEMASAVEIEAVGVSIGGPLDLRLGVLLNPPHLPGWEGLELRRIMEEKFQVPAFVEHDGNAGALAEWFWGAGHGYTDLVFLTLGTGLGAGLVIGGRLHRGISSTAGEIGHLRLAEDGPEAFGKRGCVESFCSGSGIPKYARFVYPQLPWPEPLTSEELAGMARAAREPGATPLQRAAADVYARSGRMLGRTMALIVDMLNPQIIVLGSLAMRCGDLLLPPAFEELRREALPTALGPLRIVAPGLGEDVQRYAPLAAVVYGMAAGERG